MTMIIIHGDNQIASRAQFLAAKSAAKSKGQDIVDLNGSDITLGDLVTSASSISFLGSSNAVFIEGLFSRRPSNEKKSLIEYLSTHLDCDITLWETKDVTVQLKNFDPKFIKKFDLPKYVFQFIDNLSLSLFHQSLAGSEPEMLLGLLAKRLHDLILVKEAKLNLPAWQLSKLESQAKRFSLSELIDLNNQLLNIDFKQKTSATPLDLKSALEIWILNLNSKH